MYRVYRLLAGLILLAALPLSQVAALENTSQLKNINTTTIDVFEKGTPRSGLDLVSNGKLAFFAYKDPAHGRELWSSDGTAAGTKLIYDTKPGPDDGSISPLRMIGSQLFFQADGLWVSDGSSIGTHPVVITDTADTYPHVLKLNIAESPVAGKALLYDVASAGPLDLWLSDGTSAGTTKLTTIPLHPPSSAAPELFSSFTVGSTTYFSVSYSYPDTELWKTDGTEAGTIKIATFDFGIRDWAAVDNTLYFLAIRNAKSGLWKSDGSEAGTQLVRAVPALDELTAVGSTLYFQGTDGTASSNVALWKSDGTSAGTTIVQSFSPFNGGYNMEVRHLTNVAGKLYLAGENGRPSVLNGDTIVQIAPSVLIVASEFKPAFTDFGGATYFFGLTGGKSELWKSDGTAANTVRVAELAPQTFYMTGAMVVVANRLAMTYGGTTSDGIGTFWISDGSSVGSTKVLPHSYEAGISFRDRDPVPQFTEVNSSLFFAADDGLNGNELWVSDGTAANTHMVKDIYPGANPIFVNGGDPQLLFSYKGKLYFIATDSTGTSLWQSDGTDAGTVLVKNLSRLWYGTSILEHDGVLYFTVEYRGESQMEMAGALWRSDGTTAGTQLVATSGSANNLILSNNLFYFIGSNGAKVQLLASDGTPGNKTVALESLPSNNAMPKIFSLADLNGVLYFLYFDGQSATALYKTSGTPESTASVKTIGLNTIMLLSDMKALHNKLYFRFGNSDTAALWVSDGTAAGTGELYKFVTGGPFSDGTSTISQMIAVDDRLLFRASDNVHGDELWVSDGSAAGTHMLRDINVGFLGSNITNMKLLGGKLYFAATNGAGGMELWVSNGYEGTTSMVAEIGAGPASSNPQGMGLFGKQVFFVANDGSTGAEVWSAAIPKNFSVRLPAVHGP